MMLKENSRVDMISWRPVVTKALDYLMQSGDRSGSFRQRSRAVFASASLVVACLLSSMAVADVFKLDLGSALGKRLTNLPENAWVQVNINEFRAFLDAPRPASEAA